MFPEFLYHASLKTNQDSILTQGLKPMKSRYRGRVASREGFVYLGTLAKVLDYKNDFEQEGHESVIFQVDTKGLFNQWYADEDNLEHWGEFLVDPEGNHIKTSLYPHDGSGVVIFPFRPHLAYKFFGFDRPPHPKIPGQEETLAQWAARHDLCRAEVVKYSLQVGTLAYRGSISADRISLVQETIV